MEWLTPEEVDQLLLTAAQESELESRVISLHQDRQDAVKWADLKIQLERRPRLD
jgi:hypothetical protein